MTQIPPSATPQGLQFPLTPSQGQEEGQGRHLELFHPHPGCSSTTSRRNPATKALPHRHSALPGKALNLESSCPRLTKTRLHQRLDLSQPRDEPKPSRFYQTLNPTPWLYDCSFSHCPTFEKVCFTWKHLGNSIHSVL